jgi:transposase-like protein
MRYLSSVRRQVCLRLRGGEPVTEIAANTSISPATLFRWKAQALIDAGVNDGVPSVEADEWHFSVPDDMHTGEPETTARAGPTA